MEKMKLISWLLMIKLIQPDDIYLYKVKIGDTKRMRKISSRYE